MADLRAPQRLLLTGIPGTGKTEAGHTLARQHGFVHLDAERFAQEASAGTTWQDFLAIASREVEAGSDVVITWGFMPGTDEVMVRRLQSQGFKMIWFDGDRAAARREFLRRATVNEALLDIQLQRIAALDLDSFALTRFNPFDDQGRFLSREDIARRLLALAD